jgi:cytochrome c oxidase subunit 1
MLIRTQLLHPNTPTFSPGQYLTIVGLHGSMMIMMVSSIILGPFGHYFLPLMIGSRRMAFPRLEALSFWLLPLAGLILTSTIAYGGFPTGWTGYPSLASTADIGMDGYLFSFALVGVGMILNALNMLVTVFNYRAPGMTWNRLPIFVWGMLTTSVLMLLGPPMLLAACFMEVLDRTSGTTFFSSPTGGSPFLWENLFWFFGHPEVYILALPGFAIVLEILPVFARKPLWGYRLAVAGMLGVTLLSFMVWQHHLFVSGINGNLRPFYMLTTELISVPTGFIFLVGIATLWRARIRYTVPMLFALAFFVNFLIGGLSGVYLSDVPSDVTLHGSFFVMAHFHYTIMGGLVFAFFAGIYYWIPKMAGVEMNEMLGKIHFWTAFVFFNSTFLPLFAVGMLGQPRRVSVYAPHLQFLNDWVSISAFCLGASMLVFLGNLVVAGRRPRARRTEPVDGAVARVAAAHARPGREFRPAGPHPGRAVRVRQPERAPRDGARGARAGGGGLGMVPLRPFAARFSPSCDLRGSQIAADRRKPDRLAPWTSRGSGRSHPRQ